MPKVSKSKGPAPPPLVVDPKQELLQQAFRSLLHLGHPGPFPTEPLPSFAQEPRGLADLLSSNSSFAELSRAADAVAKELFPQLRTKVDADQCGMLSAVEPVMALWIEAVLKGVTLGRLDAATAADIINSFDYLYENRPNYCSCGLTSKRCEALAIGLMNSLKMKATLMELALKEARANSCWDMDPNSLAGIGFATRCHMQSATWGRQLMQEGVEWLLSDPTRRRELLDLLSRLDNLVRKWADSLEIAVTAYARIGQGKKSAAAVTYVFERVIQYETLGAYNAAHNFRDACLAFASTITTVYQLILGLALVESPESFRGDVVKRCLHILDFRTAVLLGASCQVLSAREVEEDTRIIRQVYYSATTLTQVLGSHLGGVHSWGPDLSARLDQTRFISGPSGQVDRRDVLLYLCIDLSTVLLGVEVNAGAVAALQPYAESIVTTLSKAIAAMLYSSGLHPCDLAALPDFGNLAVIPELTLPYSAAAFVELPSDDSEFGLPSRHMRHNVSFMVASDPALRLAVFGHMHASRASTRRKVEGSQHIRDLIRLFQLHVERMSSRRGRAQDREQPCPIASFCVESLVQEPGTLIQTRIAIFEEGQALVKTLTPRFSPTELVPAKLNQRPAVVFGLMNVLQNLIPMDIIRARAQLEAYATLSLPKPAFTIPTRSRFPFGFPTGSGTPLALPMGALGRKGREEFTTLALSSPSTGFLEHLLRILPTLCSDGGILTLSLLHDILTSYNRVFATALRFSLFDRRVLELRLNSGEKMTEGGRREAVRKRHVWVGRLQEARRTTQRLFGVFAPLCRARVEALGAEGTLPVLPMMNDLLKAQVANHLRKMYR